MNLKIIEATGEWLGQLRVLGITTYRQYFSGIWSEAGISAYLEGHFELSKLQRDLAGDVVKYFLALVDEEPVGFLKLKNRQPLPNRDSEHGLELEKIYLLENFAGRGFGKALIDFVIEYAESRREKFVWLDVLKINQKAVRFYEKQGFHIVDEFEFSTDIAQPDMLVMKYEI